MQDNKPTNLQRYIKGMNSIQRSYLDPIAARGWDAVRRKENTSAIEPGDGMVELLLGFSAGKTWPKWNALFFSICTIIYCYLNAYSILQIILFTGIAAFCGYAIIGIALVSAILGGIGLFIYFCSLLIGLIW